MNATDTPTSDARPTTKGAVVSRCSPTLSGRQRRHLRSLGHHLNPVVMVGDKGVHEGVIKQIDRALEDHELIKVKVHGSDDAERASVADAIFEAIGGQTVQIIGNMLLVFRPDPDEPSIKLPTSA